MTEAAAVLSNSGSSNSGPGKTAARQKESRVGKQPIEVPAGVEVRVEEGKVHVKGPKGASMRKVPEAVSIEQQANKQLRVHFQQSSGQLGTQFQGLVWAMLRNMVEGVSKGYSTYLDLVGVGYRAELTSGAQAGQSELTMALGLSHSVKVTLPAEIKARVEIIDQGGTKRPRLHLESHDKDLLGQIAAKIRSYRPPEPYKGKGVRLKGEKVREKAGKAGGKGGKGAKGGK